jgi:hypothetical protein
MEEGCAELFDRLCGASHFLEKGCEGLVTPWSKVWWRTSYIPWARFGAGLVTPCPRFGAGLLISHSMVQGLVRDLSLHGPRLVQPFFLLYLML